MKTRNDGSKGKSASDLIAEDAERNNKMSPDSYKSSANYEGDAGDLDVHDVQNIDDDFLKNDEFEENFDDEADS